MTAQTLEARLVGTAPVLLPKVDLLPPEIQERRAFRRVQAGLGGAVCAAALVVGGLFVLANSSVGSAQEEMATADATHDRLSTQAASYDEVTAVYRRAAEAQSMLASAMGEEVRYSQLLNELSLSIPKGVWLTNVTFTQKGAAGAAATDTTGGIGTVTATGTALAHGDISQWLETLAGEPTYADPALASSAENLLGDRTVVTWSTSTTLTPGAYSDRYTRPGGK